MDKLKIGDEFEPGWFVTQIDDSLKEHSGERVTRTGSEIKLEHTDPESGLVHSRRIVRWD